MSLIHIAWRNFCHRPLSSLLTSLSLALGVGLVVWVVSIYGIVTDAFTRNSTVGYNLVVGPPGSPLQITLNSVFYLSQPVENLRYEYYMEFFDQPARAAMAEAHGGGKSLIDRDGQFASAVASGFAIPLALGDYYGKFRLVGTTPEFFELLRYGDNLDQEFPFREGRPLKTETPENGFFEAVLGHRVAKEMNKKVGDVIYPSHGDPEGKTHGEGFTIVGVMGPTGTPNDRAAFVNLEGFYLMEGHADDIPEGDRFAEEIMKHNLAARAEGDYRAMKPLPIELREVTAILLKTGLMFGPMIHDTINESKQARVAAPTGEIYKLMDVFVGPIMKLLLAITSLTCVVAAVGILVAIYNSMNDRRRDIAVMRALGARRETVTAVIVLESVIVAVAGGAAGWLVAHGAIAAVAPIIEDQTGVAVGFFTTSPAEVFIAPIVLVLAVAAALLPAWSAYRTDVGSNLAA